MGQAREEQAAARRLRAGRSRLEAERRRLQAEISSYPAPVAGCDEQFNYLLARRTEVGRALARLEAAARERRRSQDGGRDGG